MLPPCREHRNRPVFSFLEMCKGCYQRAGAQVRPHLLKKNLFWSFDLVLVMGVKRRQDWFTPGMMLWFCLMVHPMVATLPLAPGDVATGSPPEKGLSGDFRDGFSPFLSHRSAPTAAVMPPLAS